MIDSRPQLPLSPGEHELPFGNDLRPRPRVKICGITNEADALAAVAAGADALGFNTWRGSKRYLDLPAAAPWLRTLPSHVTRVALTVNEDLGTAQQLAARDYVDVVQVHGDESPAYVSALSQGLRRVIKALRVGRVDDFVSAEHYLEAAVLLDAKVAGEYGGTGVPVELELAQEFQRRYPHRRLILAGGLTPDNVARAVAHVRPYAVDVSSGVESGSPLRKDLARVRDFVAAAHGA